MTILVTRMEIHIPKFPQTQSTLPSFSWGKPFDDDFAESPKLRLQRSLIWRKAMTISQDLCVPSFLLWPAFDFFLYFGRTTQSCKRLFSNRWKATEAVSPRSARIFSQGHKVLSVSLNSTPMWSPKFPPFPLHNDCPLALLASKMSAILAMRIPLCKLCSTYHNFEILSTKFRAMTMWMIPID